jgi:predicted cupin superfamily sugar epimerase
MTVKEIIEKLGLTRHPEGGYFAETYRSEDFLDEKSRNVSTAIYYLLEGKDKSKLHRLKSDEIWHFYAGSSLVIEGFDEEGNTFRYLLGSDILRGEKCQVIIKKGTWFGACLDDSKSYALVGCTVAPGFDFDDFEMGDREILLKNYPQHKEIIEKLT